MNEVNYRSSLVVWALERWKTSKTQTPHRTRHLPNLWNTKKNNIFFSFTVSNLKLVVVLQGWKKKKNIGPHIKRTLSQEKWELFWARLIKCTFLLYRFIVTQVQCIPVMLFYFILVTICFESTDSVCIIKSLDIRPVLHHLHVYNTITHSVTIIMQRPYIRCWDEAVDNLMLTYVLWVMLSCVFIIPMWIWSYRPVWCLRRPVIRHFSHLFCSLSNRKCMKG
jgi:hypothetical protein